MGRGGGGAGWPMDFRTVEELDLVPYRPLGWGLAAGGCAIKAREYADGHFRVYVLAHLLRRESPARGQMDWLSGHCNGGEGGGSEKCDK